MPDIDDTTINRILNRLEEHSKRLKDAENAAKDYSRLALVVERLSDKVNGNGVPGMDEQIRDNRHDLNLINKELEIFKDLYKSIQPMLVFYKVGVWFASAIGFSVIALIWGLLTGEISLSFGK